MTDQAVKRERYTSFFTRHSSLIICLAFFLAPSAGCRRASTPAGAPGDNVYRIPLTDNPVTLDPAHLTDVNSGGVAARLFNGLVKLDADLRPVPDLAERWEVSPDGLTYTFHLRDGVRFHNGREATAEDVRYSYERLLLPDRASRMAWVVEPIRGARDLREGKADGLAGLTAPDDRTVVLTLDAPFPPILSQLAMVNAAVLPREEVEKTDVPFGRRPVGTGPFRFKTWQDNHVVELVRNDDYFEGPARLAGIRFRVITEAQVAWQEYQAGNLEHCAVPEGMLEQVRAGPHAAELRSSATLSTYYLGIMMTHPAGENVHLRRALNYAVDRAFICEKVLGGAHAPARGILPPGMPGHNPDLAGYSSDPERARRELEKAGYGLDNPPLEMTLFCRSGTRTQQVAEAVQSDLKRAGIPATIRTLDFAALLEATGKEEPDLFYLAWVADFPDADNFLQLFNSSRLGHAGNRVHYVNAEVDALLDRSRRETDLVRRENLLRKIEETVIADAPWVFLSHGRTHLLVRPYVRGFELTPMDVGTSVNEVDFHKISLAGDAEERRLPPADR